MSTGGRQRHRTQRYDSDIAFQEICLKLYQQLNRSSAVIEIWRFGVRIPVQVRFFLLETDVNSTNLLSIFLPKASNLVSLASNFKPSTADLFSFISHWNKFCFVNIIAQFYTLNQIICTELLSVEV